MEKQSDNANQLWVHLSGFADGNIFAIYPKILEEIFMQEEQNRDEGHKQDIDNITLPSDMEWRLKVYFQLVQKQREMDDLPSESPALEKLRVARRWSRPDSASDPWTNLGSMGMSASARRAARALLPGKHRCSRDPPWGPKDLAKAARLLESPPLAVSFDDDQEMRRVYSLIYDVFRYKCVLEEALTETGFYTIFKDGSDRKSLCWLLLFDQQRRRWANRDLINGVVSLTRQRDVRGRSRSRRKQSKDSLRMSRESSTDSWKTRVSRDSSLDGRQSRNSLLRSKVRAVKDMSADAKEAIKQAKETFDLELERGSNYDAKHKFQSIREVSNSAKDDTDLEGIGEVKEEGQENFQVERKSSDGSNGSAKLIKQDTAEDLEYTISRNEMRDVMEMVAGEIGACVKNFDVVLWDNRVKIAAGIAKIRIRNKALTLSELLPPHLRDERVTASSQRETMTGWVNVFKSRSISELVQRFNEMGFSYSTSRNLEANQFRFDRYCPKFLSMKPAIRSDFVRSSLLMDNIIVLQEREFCLGAAALCRALKDAQLYGDVVQTHGTSPKAVAYLAAQLRDWPGYQGQLIVFGAGDRKAEYECFLRALGATNTRVFAEYAWELGGSLWARAVAALAAPPNSYSAVVDPIDLVCSRGGDLRMLEALTESEISLDGKDRVMKILEEQKRTLRLCMSKPQIQMIIYETHSALSAENGDMVKRAVAEANRAARELHTIRRQKAKEALPKAPKCAMIVQQAEATVDSGNELEEAVVPNGPIDESVSKTEVPEDSKSIDILLNEESIEDVLSIERSSADKLLEEDKTIDNTILHPPPTIQPASPLDTDSKHSDIEVPDCDIFEEEYPYILKGMPQHERDGCFLALIQRKELIRMNEKYMINVAEARGLFGGNTPRPRRVAPSRKKTEDVQKTQQSKKKLTKSEMERIAAPTHAWSARVNACSLCTDGTECAPCSACARRHALLLFPRARLWWRLAIRHVLTSESMPLYLPRGSRAPRPPMSLPVAKPRFDHPIESPHYGCMVYSKILEAIENI